MAADAYLRAAAGDLEKAAMEVKSQMDRARSDYKAYESETLKFINSTESDIRYNMSQIAANSEEKETVAHITAQNMKLKQDVEQKKNELKQRRAELDQIVSNKEGTRNDLISDAHSLANKSGNPALR